MFHLGNSTAILPYLGDGEELDMYETSAPSESVGSPSGASIMDPDQSASADGFIGSSSSHEPHAAFDDLPTFTQAIQQLSHDTTTFYPVIKTSDTDLLQLAEPLTIELIQKHPLGSAKPTRLWSAELLPKGTHLPDIVGSTLAGVEVPILNSTPESVHGHLTYSIRVTYTEKAKGRFRKPRKVSALLPLTITRSASQSCTSIDRGARYVWPERADVTMQLSHSKLVNDMINLKLNVKYLTGFECEGPTKLVCVTALLTQQAGTMTSTYSILRDAEPKSLDYSLSVKGIPLNSSTSPSHPYPVSHLVSTTLRFQFVENTKTKFYDVVFRTRINMNLNEEAPPVYGV